MRCRLERDYGFEAAHHLPRAPEGHKCRRLHGHSYRVTVVVFGEISPETGWVLDFADIDERVEPLIARLDHQTLNEVEGLENATCELLAAWLWQRLAPALAGLAEIAVAETDGARCVYRGE